MKTLYLLNYYLPAVFLSIVMHTLQSADVAIVVTHVEQRSAPLVDVVSPSRTSFISSNVLARKAPNTITFAASEFADQGIYCTICMEICENQLHWLPVVTYSGFTIIDFHRLDTSGNN